MESFISLIESAIASIKRLIKRFIKGVLSFFENVVAWFKKLTLVKGRDIPFLMTPSKMKEYLDVAPVHNCGVFNAVYNYCCPLNFKTTRFPYPQRPSIGVADSFFEK